MFYVSLIYVSVNPINPHEGNIMNNTYNYSDFNGVVLTANNELEPYRAEPQLQQVTTHAQETPYEKHIEDMLLNHSRYYVYCE